MTRVLTFSFKSSSGLPLYHLFHTTVLRLPARTSVQVQPLEFVQAWGRLVKDNLKSFQFLVKGLETRYLIREVKGNTLYEIADLRHILTN